MSRERSHRSDSYQYKIVETNASVEFLASFSNAQSLNPDQYNEQILELKDQLKNRTVELTDLHLTNRQKIIWKLYCDGYTQYEISKILKVNQSSICKSINGNTDYKNGTKNYGGILKKMRRICLADAAIQKILMQLEELEDTLRL